MNASFISQLKGTKIFKSISEEEIEKIIKEVPFRTVDYKKGEVLFWEGDKCTGIGIVLEGEVEIHKGAIMGKKITITQIKHGDMFGEAIVFSTTHEYPATVEALLDSKILFISKENILMMCSNHVQFVEKFMEVLSNKILILNNKLSLLSLKSIRQKILFYIIKESKDKKNMSINITKQEFSEILGVERPSLSRELIKMKEENIIEIKGKTIKILSQDSVDDYL
ncbi:CRP-like cAMP-binding protein [Acetoanaerobium pronyense]|uniref:CRP-like cAMP-binding protein n=1 Tax=Acetoanaerobium pronyense TaxID=1482736 RepID=A0ABS4KLV4_9FIRM|nr:Crp/Fnr family transcriptional regulator [Acetoanaerobium pronyense]MBP2028206.1 CRP-like cAMP-binding protein [Acetoanaerobium pronyense]